MNEYTIATDCCLLILNKYYRVKYTLQQNKVPGRVGVGDEGGGGGSG